MADIGYGSLILAFLVALYAIAAFAFSLRRKSSAWGQSARNATLATTGLISVASLCLLYLLVTHDFSVSYVFAHVNNAQPLFYTLAAFWAGQEGSLLFWLWMLTLLAGWIALRPGASAQVSRPYLLAALSGLLAFLLFVQIVASNPFVTQDTFPADGQGLNPLLQNFWMIVHPPVVFIGYALYAIPFALVIAGLWSGVLDGGFWADLRRWSLWGWLFLGAGILLGAWWAYVELGWGGYWGWDPVENSSLIPWLIGTALLHTAIAQERRGMYRLWVLLLTAFTFLFCLFATFVTRSGLIQSVHAFERSSIGYVFLAFMGGLLALILVLLYVRRARYADEYETSSLLSREASFLFVNLLFLGIALIVLIGTIFPALSELLRGTTATLNNSFYVRAAAPLFCGALCPVGHLPAAVLGADLTRTPLARAGRAPDSGRGGSDYIDRLWRASGAAFADPDALCTDRGRAACAVCARCFVPPARARTVAPVGACAGLCGQSPPLWRTSRPLGLGVHRSRRHRLCFR